MNDDFDNWNHKKKEIHQRIDSHKILFKERDIWWCHIGQNIGRENKGKGELFLRPVIILKKLGRETFFGVPLTTSLSHHKYLIVCEANDGHFRQAHISQLRIFDSKRLVQSIAVVKEQSFQCIRKAIKDML